ncbi:MAG: hypothetical protein LBV21_05565 [Candidatus Adiutrix sp.]|jgi:hypothetical protein|nr:hypothetical protein [Candidatus Adiutrix sp.]
MKALVNRELPEAAKQIREIQGLLRTAADGLLAKLEELDGRHRALAETAARLEEDAADGEALAEGVRQARAAGAALFEKISFQDLAGQRLTKVENFLKALGILVGPGPATRGPAGKVKKKSGGSRLKGPQAAGGGLDQGHIDALLTGRTF